MPPAPLVPLVLEGRFVRLEPLAPAHHEGLRAIAQNERIWRFMTADSSGEGFDRWFDGSLARSDGKLELTFAVRLLAEDRLVGSSRYLRIEPAHRCLEIGGTWYDQAVWAGTVNPECKLLMLRHALETLGWRRVEFKTDARNERSRAAIARLGAREEGTFRKHMQLASGHIRDTVWFSVIDDDWPAVKAGLEARLAG